MLHTIRVYQESKTMWVAVGQCMGKRLSANGSSEHDAIKRWIAAVRRKLNLSSTR